MARNTVRTGKQSRPKTTVKGKRYRCARCRKRSPKPVKTPAPWYCPNCYRTTNAISPSDPNSPC
jgi:late competence protein required for DNA uptake (superfamily II DNA/RNA helicase)